MELTQLQAAYTELCIEVERLRAENARLTINREAKNVPTSLYLDLLRHLPTKNSADVIKERATDLATELRRDVESPFFERIAVVTAPKAGQISLVNFVRKISIHIAKNGVLSPYSERDQIRVVSNYYQGLRNAFPEQFDDKDSLFFKTLGFGALWNIFPYVFSLALKEHKGFTVKDVAAVFKRSNMDFSTWSQYGSGDQAERMAGEDLRASLAIAFHGVADRETIIFEACPNGRGEWRIRRDRH